MPEDQLKAFLEAVKAVAALREKLMATGDINPVVATAKEAGCVISTAGLQRVQAENSDELEGLAGGIAYFGVSMSFGQSSLLIITKPIQKPKPSATTGALWFFNHS